jgi:hypothetical protein
VSGSVLSYTVSDVIPGGQILLTQLFETFIGSGQPASASGVTVTITAANGPSAGTGTPVPATSTGLSSTSGSLYTYTWNCLASTAPGDYAVTFAGNVGGTAIAYSWTVTVAAPPAAAPAPGVYATLAQYQEETGDHATPSSLVTAKLRLASDDLDMALVGAVYPTNPQGMPNDPLVINVLMRACCQQVAFLLADNDDQGVKRQYSTTSSSGVSATRTASAQGMLLPPLGPRALQILRTNGVLQAAVLIGW